MHKKCLLCENSQLKKLESFSEAHLVKCTNCGFVFAQNIPSEKELIDFYDGYGREDYLSPHTVQRYHELLDKMEPFRKTNRLLDVGCGIGYFLEIAKERGWEVFGTEYTDKAIEICEAKGIQMKQGKLNPVDFEKESFDIITSFEVLEHINNPIEETHNFAKLLRIGGLVYLTTPNFNSLLRYKLKEEYNVITYPEHLSYYTPKTLKKLFQENGFKKKSIQTTGISVSRLRAKKSQPSAAPAVSKNSDDEKLRNQIESNAGLKILKKTINSGLTVVGVGDSLKGWFIKR